MISLGADSGLEQTASHFVSYCSSTNRIFVLLSDRSVLELEETDSGTFRVGRQWILDERTSYQVSESTTCKLISVARTETDSENERFSQFGLSVVQENRSSNTTIDGTSNRIACTGKHLYVAYAELDCDPATRLARIDLEDNAVMEFVDFLSPGVHIRDIKCGYAHAVVLDSLGCVYTLGIGTRGELGHGDLEPQTSPKMVEALAGVRVRKIAVGGWHTAIVTGKPEGSFLHHWPLF